MKRHIYGSPLHKQVRLDADCYVYWQLAIVKRTRYEDYNNIGKREPDFYLLDRQQFSNNIALMFLPYENKV